MQNDDAITALARQRLKLMARSRDTGVPCNVELAEIDQQIGLLAENDRLAAVRQQARGRDR